MNIPFLTLTFVDVINLSLFYSAVYMDHLQVFGRSRIQFVDTNNCLDRTGHLSHHHQCHRFYQYHGRHLHHTSRLQIRQKRGT